MNNLIVTDVFDAYYDGRKSEFAEGNVRDEAARRNVAEKERAPAANKDQRLPKAA